MLAEEEYSDEEVLYDHGHVIETYRELFLLISAQVHLTVTAGFPGLDAGVALSGIPPFYDCFKVYRVAPSARRPNGTTPTGVAPFLAVEKVPSFW